MSNSTNPEGLITPLAWGGAQLKLEKSFVWTDPKGLLAPRKFRILDLRKERTFKSQVLTTEPTWKVDNFYLPKHLFFGLKMEAAG